MNCSVRISDKNIPPPEGSNYMNSFFLLYVIIMLIIRSDSKNMESVEIKKELEMSYNELVDIKKIWCC